MQSTNRQSEETRREKSAWAIGGGVLIGLGVGFFVLHLSALFFVGSIIGGIGLGLLAGAIISR